MKRLSYQLNSDDFFNLLNHWTIPANWNSSSLALADLDRSVLFRHILCNPTPVVRLSGYPILSHVMWHGTQIAYSAWATRGSAIVYADLMLLWTRTSAHISTLAAGVAISIANWTAITTSALFSP
jgi:hypothetical protein